MSGKIFKDMGFMTSIRTTLEITGMLISVCLFIFFAPYVLGQKEPAIEASIKQNMVFLNEIVLKYHEHHQAYPVDLNQLAQDARAKRYSKTLFNPILKHAGDLNNDQIVIKYPDFIFQKLDQNDRHPEYTGKTGYFTDGAHYVIYGHLANGERLKENGQIFSIGNF